MPALPITHCAGDAGRAEYVLVCDVREAGIGTRLMLTRLATNGLWLASCLPQALLFRGDVHRVAEAQRRLLLGYVRKNRETTFGRRHDFASMRTIEDFQVRVPLTSFEDYAPYLDAISAGQQNVLTSEAVLRLVPTSGSTAVAKLCPYTSSLKTEFQRALGAWLCDLYRHEPSLIAGQAYWSMSPIGQRAARTSGGVAVGFEDDTEYLSPWQRRFAQSVMAVPSKVRLIDDIESFRYVTLLYLLRSRSLSLISVWHPTFLSLIVGRLPAWREALVADVSRGCLTPPQSLSADLLRHLSARLTPDPRRAREAESAFRSAQTPADLHARLWPDLRLVSCWADANARPYADELAHLFPQARVQGKGILATEGCVSFPLWRHTGAALAVRSHFFEFVPSAKDGVPRLAHELQEGERYAVVMTTGGGLYRYQLQDLIEVTGHLGECPLVRLIGRTSSVSDWFGEKLNELHVARVVASMLDRSPVRPAFVMLACDTSLSPPAYVLYIEAASVDDDELRTLGRAVESGLCENFHYRYCRQLGQLAAVRVFHVQAGANEAYQQRCVSAGQRLGDVKPVVLDRRTGWTSAFAGTLC